MPSFLFSSFLQGVETKDAEGQALALSFTRSRIVGENVSEVVVQNVFSCCSVFAIG